MNASLEMMISEPGTEPNNARRRLPTTVIALGVTSFFADVGSEMIFPLLPVFVASLGASTMFLGLVEGLADATSSLLKLASGYVADHSRRKKPLVLFGYGVATIVRPLVALATAPWHVLAVRVTDRVGKGIRSAPRDVLIASSVSREDTGRAFGFHRAMDHAGAVVGPLIATALLSLGWPLRHVFWVALIPGVLSVIAVATVREPHVDAVAHEPAPADGPRRLPGSLRSYLAILLLFSLGNSSDAFLLLRARDLGVPIASLPLLWMAFHIAKLVSSYLGGGWSDRIARPKLIVTGWMVYAVTYLAFGMATRSWHAWALFIVYGAYYGLTEPAEKALVKDLTSNAIRGRAYGFYNFIIGVSAVPAGILTGWLWQTWGPLVALATGAGVAAAASVALIVWASTSNVRPPATEQRAHAPPGEKQGSSGPVAHARRSCRSASTRWACRGERELPCLHRGSRPRPISCHAVLGCAYGTMMKMRTRIHFRFLASALFLIPALSCAEPPVETSYNWHLPPGFPEPRVPENNPMSNAKVVLGRHLFFDVRLSANRTQSCGSCHQSRNSFTDGRARGSGSTGEDTPRGSMAIINVAYNFTQTWANPALTSLEDQALVPIFGEHPVELGLSGQEDELLRRLRQEEPRYQTMFRAAFPQDTDPFTITNIVRAISCFERSLISGNAPADRFVHGDSTAISAAAQRGLALFNSERLQCFHCHGGFNYAGEADHVGNLLGEQEYENNGLYNIDGLGGYPEPNRGLFEFTREPRDMGRFRAPTLRNIAETAPYMHDGSLETLEDVIAHYARGGREIVSGPNAGDGRASPVKSVFVAGFTLSDQEREDLLAFLRALTDRDFINDPSHIDPWR